MQFCEKLRSTAGSGLGKGVIRINVHKDVYDYYELAKEVCDPVVM